MARRRRTKQKKTIILTSILAITIFMATGYSLLSQSLKLEGEANLYASKRYLWYQIIENYTSENNGYFYENQFETGKYSYIGNNNTNYISLDGELWRIISVEKDHTIKVARFDDSLITAFDEIGNRTQDSTYCTNLQYGCNSWASQSELVNAQLSGKVVNDSTILTYLNTTFYDSLSDELKSNIVEHRFNIGAVSDTSSFAEAIIEEQENTWNGHVGLLTLSEILYPNNNINITIGESQNNNYLLEAASGKILWTATPMKNNSSQVWVINHDKTQVGKDAYLSSETENDISYNFVAVPTLHLKDTVKLADGNGSINTPFTIEK